MVRTAFMPKLGTFHHAMKAHLRWSTIEIGYYFRLLEMVAAPVYTLGSLGSLRIIDATAGPKAVHADRSYHQHGMLVH